MPDIIVVGDINVDVIFTIPAYPIPGNEAVASTVQLHTGGSGVNTAIALAKMDMDVGFVGRIGQDALAKQVLIDLQEAGVDCSHLQVDPKVSTGLIFIAVTPDGERTMFSARGANVFVDVRELDVNYFSSSRWIHLSGYSFLSYQQYETLRLALDIAETSPHTRVSLDIGVEPALRARPQILQALPRIDVIFPNAVELSLLSGGLPLDDGLHYLLNEQKANAIVAKQGRHGSILATGHHRLNLPAFDIEVKDTTGAGDSFNAGVVLGRLVGLSWGASLALGNALGGLAASQDGGALTSVSKNTVVRLLEKHFIHEAWQPHQGVLEELTAYFEGVS